MQIIVHYLLKNWIFEWGSLQVKSREKTDKISENTTSYGANEWELIEVSF